ncbi:hypothetical protein SAMN02745753_03715 [Marinomonas polaris DSM 16579]|uniref:Uncharacterized protein n=1 Tax=Marinomonas polaris DSM 16579 TaxID=1122206 RepID=A0A1M5IYZ5_9GAMM|nr:hypothetical protein [Marinomonas polaris]SHG33491.1 hypothetical protein SAMN02745753_03715 [Marinomonas polaris DSM 16579]
MTSLSSQLKALPRQNLEIGERQCYKSSIHSFLYHAVVQAAKSTNNSNIEAYEPEVIKRNYNNDPTSEKMINALILEMNLKLNDPSNDRKSTLDGFINDLSY